MRLWCLLCSNRLLSCWVSIFLLTTTDFFDSTPTRLIIRLCCSLPPSLYKGFPLCIFSSFFIFSFLQRFPCDSTLIHTLSLCLFVGVNNYPKKILKPHFITPSPFYTELEPNQANQSTFSNHFFNFLHPSPPKTTLPFIFLHSIPKWIRIWINNSEKFDKFIWIANWTQLKHLLFLLSPQTIPCL